MVNSQLLWISMGYALALAACAPAVQEQDLGFATAPPAGESTLVVRNDYLGEVDIYVVAGSTRTRLGSVPTAGTGDFRITRLLLARSEIQFQIDPIGPVGPFTYQPLSVGPRSVVELAVAPALQMSSYAIVLHH